MKGSFARILVFSCAAALLLWNCNPLMAESKVTSDNPAQELLSIGQPGPKAIDLTVSEQSAGVGASVPGAPMSVTVKASRKGYLTAVYVSPKGDVVVLFPNRKTADSLVSPDKECPLANAASIVKLIKSRKKGESGRVALFVSSQPLNLDAFKMRATQNFVCIPRSAKEQMALLTDKLQALAKDGDFNRVVLANEVTVGGNVMNLMGGPPGGIRSSRPGSTVGVQGIRERIKDTGKE